MRSKEQRRPCHEVIQMTKSWPQITPRHHHRQLHGWFLGVLSLHLVAVSQVETYFTVALSAPRALLNRAVTNPVKRLIIVTTNSMTRRVSTIHPVRRNTGVISSAGVFLNSHDRRAFELVREGSSAVCSCYLRTLAQSAAVNGIKLFTRLRSL